MAGLGTYTLLKASVIDWMNRSGFTALEDNVEDFIAMAQRRIHRTCDLNCMETVLATFSLSGATYATPTGFLRAKTITIQDGTSYFEINGAAYKKVVQAGTSDRPRYYSVIGDNFHFGPTPDQAYTVEVVYYKELDILSSTTATNWLSTNVPELLLFGALIYAAKWAKDDVRVKEFTAEYERIRIELMESETRQDREGGSLQVRRTNDEV